MKHLRFKYFLFIFLLYSCKDKQVDFDLKLSQEVNLLEIKASLDDVDKKQLKLSENIDEVVIEYWDAFYANTFVFNILRSQEEFNITYYGETLFKEKKTLTNLEQKNSIIKSINQFYIDKSSEIIIGLKGSEEILESDFPSIRVTGRRDGTEVFNKLIVLKNEAEFSSDFIAFYELLEAMVKAD